MSIYTTSTVDHPSYKRLVCGRTADFERLLTYISSGRSVALFGEKRIGKTSVLYILRDLINQDINVYKMDLLDLHLKSAIPTLQGKISDCKAVYLSLQSLTTVELKTFIVHLKQSLQSNGLLLSSISSTDQSLSGLLNELNDSLTSYERVVILIDEVEVLLEMTENRQFFRNLKSSIQAYSKICFVLSGAELWHKQIKEKTIDLVNNIGLVSLKRTELNSTKSFLIQEPIKPFISTSQDLEKVVQAVIESTRCKPLYVQEICGIVTELLIENNQLPRQWKAAMEQQAQIALEPTLDNFYTDLSLDQISRQILTLLANKPNLTSRHIAEKLGYTVKSVRDKLDDLEALDKVYAYKARNVVLGFILGKQYRISGTLIEIWGRKNQDLPALKNPWIIRLKWLVAVLFLVLASVVYFYTHPQTTTYSCSFTTGKIFISMPSSVEANEVGKVQISALNEGSEISLLTITLTSDSIEYQKEGSNRIKFEKISTGEKRVSEFNFTVRPSQTSEKLASQLLLGFENGNSSIQCPSLEISKRTLPIKNNWILISSLLTVLSGFFAKPDLPQLVASLITNLFKPSEQNKN